MSVNQRNMKEIYLRGSQFSNLFPFNFRILDACKCMRERAPNARFPPIGEANPDNNYMRFPPPPPPPPSFNPIHLTLYSGKLLLI